MLRCSKKVATLIYFKLITQGIRIDFLHCELHIVLAVMGWCVHECVCVRKSAQGAGKLTCCASSPRRGSPKMSKWCL